MPLSGGLLGDDMDQVRYKVGDVVNGHVWTGSEWVPVNHVSGAGRPMQPNQIGSVVNGHRWDGARWVPLPGQTHQAPSGSEAWYRKPAGIVGIVLAGLLGLFAIAGWAAGAGEESTSSTPAGESSWPVAPQSTPSVAAPAAPAPDGSTRVDEWSVKVVGIDPNASAAIRDANMFNEDPDYQYVVVTLQGTNGAATVKNLQSFTAKLQGSDKIVYRDESLLMVMPQELATEAAPGGTVQAQFVFDAPASALGPGALVLVDDVPVAIQS